MLSPREKLKELLRELFQFGSADLDFGIYRIMNFKRDVIEQFIQKDLIDAVDKELSSGMIASQSQAASELKDVAAQIRETLGETALNGDGSLDEAYHGTPLGKRYLDLQSRASQAQERPALETTIFNHLYAFFSRYYDNGDFLSKRRYSRREKYAIPYNGEEVYLHWANNDQYYIKTGEYFSDYRFKSPYGISVHFMLIATEVEKDNVKGDKRFFVPVPHEVTFDAERKEITIPFQYRPLTEQEGIKYGQRNQQDAITNEALHTIPAELQKDIDALPALVSTHHTTADGQVSFLEHHLRRYARRNTSDFFVHKDLKGFLTRELDFYLKNEVLNLDEIEAAGEPRSEAWFQIMHVIRSIGSRVIEFLAQIEDFQKRLFEKRKFILETQYYITMANVPEDFYAEIAECEAQWQEWKELFHLDEEQPNLFTSAAKNQKERRIATLKEHPTLVLDTKHFNQQFKDRLLATHENLDEMTDGLLIHSENFQALNLLLEKYREKVKCIYIDPPYNTAASEILYKNDYKHSSWLSLLCDRVEIATKYIRQNGILQVAIDDAEFFRLQGVLNYIMGLKNHVANIAIMHNPKGREQAFVSDAHDYTLLYAKNINELEINRLKLSSIKLKSKYPKKDSNGSYRELPLRRRGTAPFREDRPYLYFPFIYDPSNNTLQVIDRENYQKIYDGVNFNDEFVKHLQRKYHERGLELIFPIREDGRLGRWRWGYDKCVKECEKGIFFVTGQKAPTIYHKDYATETMLPKSLWFGERYDASTKGTNLLKHILPGNPYDYPKSIFTLEDLLHIGAGKDDYILDFFAGSGTTGHAVINLNREDGGIRKFILVEMGDYFNTVIIPRIKKVIFTPEWKKGKPNRSASTEEAKRSPRIVKYVRLESYEDALNNITFPDVLKTLYDFDDYLLKYMLAWETKESETLLNVEKLVSPFSYKLTITGGEELQQKPVDIPETFAYLLGLNVKTRRVYQDKERCYLVYQGNIDHRDIAVIWRETSGWNKADYERDKQFVEEQKLTEGVDEVFVNGDSYILNARSLESVFKSRMFGSM